MSGIVIYTDGGARNNPGPAGIGIVIYDGEEKISEVKRYIGKATNNVAEYEALIAGLTEAEGMDFGARSVEVRMDSELIVKQMRGEYKVKDKNLKILHGRAKGLVAGFSNIDFVHIPREDNAEADALVNEAIDSA